MFRDLPDLIYRMLGQVQALKDRTDREIVGMRGVMLEPPDADHLILEAIRADVLPASLLPRVLA
ncbi:MAG: hypothetical protein ABI837_16840, partial [Acidobacteriota bacterium]